MSVCTEKHIITVREFVLLSQVQKDQEENLLGAVYNIFYTGFEFSSLQTSCSTEALYMGP